MDDIFHTFTQRKQYLVCIDSDGCAMDTMDIKHINCFGPCMIDTWQLQRWEKAIQKRWNDINLYTMTRGINRFLGLYQVLQEVDGSYKKIAGLNELKWWVESATELSGPSLEAAIKEKDSLMLKKTLQWSIAVNDAITSLPQETKQAFAGVKECLEQLHQVADVAIVSSANQQAIMEEWKEQGFLQFTDVICSQNTGTKAYCIQKLLEQGYETHHVLVVGDAPGDREAAACNHVLFYPILVTKEKESWEKLCREAIHKFISGCYSGDYQEEKIREFEKNLGR